MHSGVFLTVYIPIFVCHFCARIGDLLWPEDKLRVNEVHVGPQFGRDGQKHFSLDQQLLAAPCTVCSWVRHGQKKMVCQGGGERPPDLPVPGSASACRYCIWM